MGRKSTTGGVTPLGDRIQLRFTWQGKELRPTLDLKPTAANLKHAARMRQTIVDDIRSGVFDLAAHFPNYKFASRMVPTDDARLRTFEEWCKVWEELAAAEHEHSTLTIYKRHLKAYWRKPFGHLMPKAITHEKVMLHLAKLGRPHEDDKGRPKKALARKTQNNLLIPARAVFELICKADKAIDNPFQGVQNKKVQTDPPDPFTAEEVELILDELAREPLVGAELADYFEFSFFAGLRISEQIALLWLDSDLRTGRVVVRRAKVLGEEKERTKTNHRRTVELNDRALAVLQRQRARTQVRGQHVFLNPWTGQPWNDEQEQRRAWEQALRRAKVRYRPPKECRDTSVTLALMAGADPTWVAKQHGHSIRTMERDYFDWIPDGDRGRNLNTVNTALGFRSKTAVAKG